MALMKGSEPAFQTAEGAAQRRGHAAGAELALRNELEALCRSRWPGARICHEMVMGARQVRADVVAICPDHIVAFEIKGEYDDTSRLLHQVGMYQICVPEVWIVAAQRHEADAHLIRHLIPSVGIVTGTGWTRHGGSAEHGAPVTLTVRAEAASRRPDPTMMLEMMWADELRAMCGRLRVTAGPRTPRASAIKALLAHAGPEELLRECCTELRCRVALWRADPPVPDTAA